VIHVEICGHYALKTPRDIELLNQLIFLEVVGIDVIIAYGNHGGFVQKLIVIELVQLLFSQSLSIFEVSEFIAQVIENRGDC